MEPEAEANTDRQWRLFDDYPGYVDRFGLLLIVTSIAVVTMSLVDLRASREGIGAEIAQIAVSVFVGATLLLALRASGVGRRFRILADILISVVILTTILVVIFTETSQSTFEGLGNPSLVWVVLTLMTPVLVVRRLIHHDHASAKTLAGALSAYMLIALAFAFAFLAVDAASTTPFFGAEEPTTSYMYYSLVTITTLGYGDLSAVEPFGRLLSTIEAVIGQVYLVTFVAMIVGLLVGQRETRKTT